MKLPTKYYVIASILIICATFLLCAFIQMDINPNNWHWITRTFMAAWTLLVGIATTTAINKADKQ